MIMQPAGNIAACGPPQGRHMQQQHSGLGIASFTVSLVSSLLMLVLFVYAGMIALASPEGIDEQAPEVIALGFAIILCGMGLLVALGLGIASLCQNSPKNIFGILGVIFSGMSVVVTSALLIIGS
jgi:hypothetical protein